MNGFSRRLVLIQTEAKAGNAELDYYLASKLTNQAPVVQRLDNAIHRINYYLMDSVVCFVNTYPLDSDLSGG